MNLRPPKINAHIDWLSGKLHGVMRSRLGDDRPDDPNSSRSYFEKIAAFYVATLAESMRAEAMLRSGGIDQASLDQFKEVARSGLPEFLKTAPPAMGPVKSRWVRFRAWLRSLRDLFTWDGPTGPDGPKEK